MQDQSDLQLLRDYAQTGSEAAFRELVARHTDFVFSAALRQVGSPDLAGDLAQGVFTDLARKARPLAEKMPAAASLAGWLHRSTRYAALNHLRDTRRRQTNERLAMEQLLTNAAADPDWNRIRPILDEALDRLADDDREAILLRYFKNQDFRTVGLALGVNDDAAQKRVSRAVDQLREFFAERKATFGAGGLAILISANAVQAAPAGLAATIATATLAGATVTTSTAVIAAKTIAMTTLQKIAVTTALAVVTGAGIYQAHQAAQLREQNLALRQSQADLTAQLEQLQRERDAATNRLASSAENSATDKNNNAELLKLRAEVTRLRQASDDAAKSPADARAALVKSWLAREDQLRQTVTQNPDKAIPEFKLLSDQQWLDEAINAKFDTDKQVQQTLADLRRSAENNFANQAQNAVTKYMATNNGAFPTDVSQLQPYFSPPMDDAILQRWEVAPGSANPGVGVGDTIITEKAPVDPALDSRWSIGSGGGYGSGTYQSADMSAAIATLTPVMKAYAADHNGMQPTDSTQILPYLTTPEQQAAYQTLMKNKSKNPASP
jgi:RNA polymerase sigma factor (sigma-70 family)